MIQVLSLQRLSEVRKTLEELTSLAKAADLRQIPRSIENSLAEIGLLRGRIFDKGREPRVFRKPPVASPPPAPVVPRKTAQVRIPAPVAPSPIRRAVTTTSTYNAERYIPYRILWIRVIVRAAYDYALWRESKEIRLRKIALDAERWLFEPSTLELGFESICEKYDFPVEKIRKRARLLTRDDVKKLEYRDRNGRELTEDAFSGEVDASHGNHR